MASIKNTLHAVSQPTVQGARIEETSVSKGAKPPLTMAKSPVPTPIATPTPGLQSIFAGIIDNTRSTFQATRQIVTTAADQAKADRDAGKGVLSGMRDFTGTVNDLATLISNHARSLGLSRSQREQLTPGQLGGIAQDYAYLSARDVLIDGAVTLSGDSLREVERRGTIDLVLENLGFGSTEGTQGASVGTPGAIMSGTKVAGGGSGLSTGATTSSQILGAVGAAYGAYQVITQWGKTDPISGAINGFTAGAYLGGAAFGPFGAAVGGVIGGVVGLASGFFKKSGKSEDQVARDKVRALMQNNGMLNQKWELTLANGAVHDIGKDGKFKLANTDGTMRRAYEVDFSNPLAAETVAMMQPLSILITGGDPKLANQFTGYFTNAALSNAKDLKTARLNGIAILESMKVAPEQLAQAIAEMVKQGAITEANGKSYIEGLVKLMEPEKTTKKSTASTSASETTRKAA